MNKRSRLLAICAIVGGVAGAVWCVLWLATLAWISATPISAERLAAVQKMAYVALAGIAASLVVVLIGVIRLFRLA